MRKFCVLSFSIDIYTFLSQTKNCFYTLTFLVWFLIEKEIIFQSFHEKHEWISPYRLPQLMFAPPCVIIVQMLRRIKIKQINITLSV